MELNTAVSKVYEMNLYEGESDGLIRFDLGEDVHCYKISKDYFDKYKDDDDIKKLKSIYILYGNGKFYIGQAGIRKDDTAITSRIKEHLKDPQKDFVEEIVFFCDSSNRWNGGELDYLEASLILYFKKQGYPLFKEQNNETIDPYLSSSVRFKYEKHLREIRIILDILGYDAIRKIVTAKETKETCSTEAVQGSNEAITPPQITNEGVKTIKKSVLDKLLIMRKGKADVCKQQLLEWGISVKTNRFNFASYSPRGHYWMEPSKDVLNEDWTFVLFDADAKEVLVFMIPKQAFTYETGKTNSLKIRNDKQELIKLEIKKSPYVDKATNQDFTPYLTDKIIFDVI